MYESTILIASYRRNELLKWNLISLERQGLGDVEIIVLDDSPGEGDSDCLEIVDDFSDRINIRYIHTGANKKGDYWRVPGFAFNIGVKQSESNFIFLCCAEIFHRNETVQPLTEVLKRSPRALAVPCGKSDTNGRITKFLNNGDGHFSEKDFIDIKAGLLVKYPFFMGMSRSEFVSIGGYDEDFIGIAVEDRDLVERLILNGCSYDQVKESHIIHLSHSRLRSASGLNDGISDRLGYNRALYRKKLGTIIRNQGKEWGTL